MIYSRSILIIFFCLFYEPLIFFFENVKELIFFIILSKKFPRGQRFPHQKRPAKKEITIGLTIQKIAARANLKSKRLKESIAIKRIKEKFFQILKIVFMLTMLACRKRKFCDKITK